MLIKVSDSSTNPPTVPFSPSRTRKKKREFPVVTAATAQSQSQSQSESQRRRRRRKRNQNTLAILPSPSFGAMRPCSSRTSVASATGWLSAVRDPGSLVSVGQDMCFLFLGMLCQTVRNGREEIQYSRTTLGIEQTPSSGLGIPGT